MDNLDVSCWKYTSSSFALADPPTVGLFLMHRDQIAGVQAQFVVQVCRVLINRSTLFRASRLARCLSSVKILIAVILGMTAELIEVAEVVLVGRILGVTIAGGAIGPMTALGLVVLAQMDVDLIIALRYLKRFVLRPRRNLKHGCKKLRLPHGEKNARTDKSAGCMKKHAL